MKKVWIVIVYHLDADKSIPEYNMDSIYIFSKENNALSFQRDILRGQKKYVGNEFPHITCDVEEREVFHSRKDWEG